MCENYNASKSWASGVSRGCIKDPDNDKIVLATYNQSSTPGSRPVPTGYPLGFNCPKMPCEDPLSGFCVGICKCKNTHSDASFPSDLSEHSVVPANVEQLPYKNGEQTSYCTACTEYSGPSGTGCNALKQDLLEGIYSKDRCKSGESVGQGSNDFSLQTSSGSPQGCFNMCTVNCTGAQTVPMKCGEEAPVAQSDCTYTGGICLDDSFQETQQPAPEDCEEAGPWGVGWTQEIEGTSRYRSCICNHWDLLWEFGKRCGFSMAEGACTALTGFFGGLCGKGIGRGNPKPPIGGRSPLPSPAMVLTGAAGAAIYAFGNQCWQDPVNAAPTNSTNCPFKRVGKDCILPPDALPSGSCPPGTTLPFPGADYCVEDNQQGMTRDIHDSYDSDINDNNKTPNCPDGSYAYDGLCFCNDTNVLYIQPIGCEEEPKDPEEYDPDLSDDINDNQQNQDRPDPPDDPDRHVWVDNFFEVTDVLEAMKKRQCGWDKDNPCFVHVNNEIIKVEVDNFDELEEYFKPLDDIKKDTGDIRKNTADIIGEIKNTEKRLKTIEEHQEKLVEWTEEEEKLLKDIKENVGCDKDPDMEDSLCGFLEKIEENLSCTDKDNNKVCDILEEEKDKEDEDTPLFTVPEYSVKPGQCPALAFELSTVAPGTYPIPTDNLCKLFEIIGLMVLASAYWRAARIYMNGVLYS